LIIAGSIPPSPVSCKGGDLSEFSAADLDTIAAKLNARPRPTLGLRTPADCLNELFLDEQHVA
jgi:IS30 family transposase